MTYSIAIRTLGTAGEKFRQELESIRAQTLLPDRVLVYIAEGYPRPGFTVGREEYIPVKKGMFTQRALPYDEVTSDCILLLDDDVLLLPGSTEMKSGWLQRSARRGSPFSRFPTRSIS